MQAVAEAAGPVWEKMNADERRPFEDLAKLERGGKNAVKYTTTGQKIDVVQKREMEKVANEQKMREAIDARIRIAAETRRIAEEIFYFIHVNHFCVTTSPNKKYYAAEIAVVRFTLGEGVTPDNVFHMIVKPGPLPIGYTFQAKKTSDDTHQLPFPMGQDAEDNLTQVMNSLMKFLTEFNGRYKVPPMYVEARNKEVVEDVLKNLAIDFGHDEKLFTVYSMEYLFYILRNTVAQRNVFPAESLSTLELEKDIYDFCQDIPCDYHSDSDVPNHCSRSHVIRCAYIICDNCCGDLGIDLIPGQHVPRQANVTSTRPQSVASGYGYYAASNASSVNNVPAWHKPQLNDYLSQQTESAMSVRSEASSVCDPIDFTLEGYEPESMSNQTYVDEEWHQPKQRHRRNDNRQMNSQSSANSNRSAFELPAMVPTNSNPSASASGNSQPESTQQCRRPHSLSAALTEMSQLSVAPETAGVPGASRNIPIRRGRGLGPAANFTKKMS